MVIRRYDVTCIETPPYHSKLPNFITSWKMINNATKVWRTFLHKIKINMQKYQGRNFMDICGSSVTYVEFKNLCNFITGTSSSTTLSLRVKFWKMTLINTTWIKAIDVVYIFTYNQSLFDRPDQLSELVTFAQETFLMFSVLKEYGKG